MHFSVLKVRARLYGHAKMQKGHVPLCLPYNMKDYPSTGVTQKFAVCFCTNTTSGLEKCGVMEPIQTGTHV